MFLSKINFLVKAKIEGIKVKACIGDTTVVHIKATAYNNSILTRRRYFYVDTLIYNTFKNETFNYCMPNYSFIYKRFGPVIPKTFFYTREHEWINKSLIRKDIGTKLKTVLKAYCKIEYNTTIK